MNKMITPIAKTAMAAIVATQVLFAQETEQPAPEAEAAIDAAAAPIAEAPVEQKQCERTYNINELLFKVKDGFPSQLKDCSAKLAKDMLLAASPFGKKAAAPEPNSFMKQCAVEGAKKNIPDGFPNAAQIIGSLDNFVQGILNSASAGGALDPKKLVSAVGSMNIEGLLSDVKRLAADDSCVVDLPYEPPAEPHPAKESVPEAKKSAVSFGIRAGLNFSHAYTEYDNVYDSRKGSYMSGKGSYDDILGMQAGFIADFALYDWLHLQPGIMYMQKGMGDDKNDATAHYIDVPLLLSFKLSALRLNLGPYFGLCLASSNSNVFGCVDYDIGLNAGIGVDIGIFYIGTFYGYGFADMSNRYGYEFYNRTLGFNLGVNL